MKNIITYLLLIVSPLISADSLVDQIIELSDAKQKFISQTEKFNKSVEISVLHDGSAIDQLNIDYNKKLLQLRDEHLGWHIIKSILEDIYLDTYSREELEYLRELLENPMYQKILNKESAFKSKYGDTLKDIIKRFSSDNIALLENHSKKLELLMQEQEQ